MATTQPTSLDVSYEDDPRVLAEAAVDDYANDDAPCLGEWCPGLSANRGLPTSPAGWVVTRPPALREPRTGS